MTTTTAPASAATTPRFQIDRRDRLSTVLVIALTVVALAAGLVLRTTVESRARSYKDAASGITFQYPDTWRLNTANAADGVYTARDINAPGYPTTFELRAVNVDPAAQDEVVLTTAANDLALNRGRDLASYKLFGVEAGQSVKGLPGASASYVFVSEPSAALQEEVPAVVLGDDTLVRKGNHVYVFSLLSTEANRAQALPAFKAFVDSAQLP